MYIILQLRPFAGRGVAALTPEKVGVRGNAHFLFLMVQGILVLVVHKGETWFRSDRISV